MNPYRTSLLVALLSFCFCGPGFSQTDFKPGVVELPSGEKLTGMIGMEKADKTPRVIFFKKEAGATEQPLTPATIKGFAIEGGASYLSQVVSKDLLPITRKDAVAAGTESTVMDRVFLKELATGSTLSLYVLNEDKVHFYIKKPGGEVAELLYKVFLRDGNRRDQVLGQDNVVYHYIFRNQLRIFALEDDGLVSQIDGASYNAKDLIKLVNGINELASEAYRKPPKAVKRISFGGGLTFGNRFAFSGPTFQQFQDLKSSTTSGYILKGNADFFGKRKLINTFVRTEVSYRHFSYKGRFQRAATADYFLTINTLSATLSVAQNIIHKKNIGAYVGAGTGINFSGYPLNDIVSTNPDAFQEEWQVKKVWHEALVLRTGMVYKNLQAELAYRFSGSPFNYPSLNTRYRMLALTLAYGFRL